MSVIIRIAPAEFITSRELGLSEPGTTSAPIAPILERLAEVMSSGVSPIIIAFVAPSNFNAFKHGPASGFGKGVSSMHTTAWNYFHNPNRSINILQSFLGLPVTTAILYFCPSLAIKSTEGIKSSFSCNPGVEAVPW